MRRTNQFLINYKSSWITTTPINYQEAITNNRLKRGLESHFSRQCCGWRFMSDAVIISRRRTRIFIAKTPTMNESVTKSGLFKTAIFTTQTKRYLREAAEFATETIQRLPRWYRNSSKINVKVHHFFILYPFQWLNLGMKFLSLKLNILTRKAFYLRVSKYPSLEGYNPFHQQ